MEYAVVDISKKKNKKDNKQEKVHTYVYNCFIESSTYFVCTALVHVYTVCTCPHRAHVMYMHMMMLI